MVGMIPLPSEYHLVDDNNDDELPDLDTASAQEPMMLPGGAYFAKCRQEERERAEESLLTPPHLAPLSQPHHHNPDTPVTV